MRRVIAICSLLAPWGVAHAYDFSDPLRDGTLGNAVGGQFGPDGWTATDRADRIWYALPRLVEGSIEFTVTNMTFANFVEDDGEIFTMYEAGYGMAEPLEYSPGYRGNHYKVMVRVYGSADVERGGITKLMWGMCPSGAPGYGDCGCQSFFEEPFGGNNVWDGSPQRIRIEWDRNGARTLRNGEEQAGVEFGDSGLVFAPENLHMTLGSPRASAVDRVGLAVGSVFSDLEIHGVEAPQTATCGGEPPPPDTDAGVVPPPQGEGLPPTDDVTVWSGGPDAPGPVVEDLSCESDGTGPIEMAYLRFDTSVLGAGRVRRAVLRLKARPEGSSEGDPVSVHGVPSAVWQEGTLTWNTRPAFDPAVAGVTPAVTPEAEYLVDVTAAVGGLPSGPMALALVGGGNGAHFRSKEAGDGPWLQVELEPAGPGQDAGGEPPPPAGGSGGEGGAVPPAGGSNGEGGLVPPPGGGGQGGSGGPGAGGAGAGPRDDAGFGFPGSGGQPIGAGEGETEADQGAEARGDCNCRLGREPAPAMAWLLPLLLLGRRRRRS